MILCLWLSRSHNVAFFGRYFFLLRRRTQKWQKKKTQEKKWLKTENEKKNTRVVVVIIGLNSERSCTTERTEREGYFKRNGNQTTTQKKA